MGCCQSRRTRDHQTSRTPGSPIATYTDEGEHTVQQGQAEGEGDSTTTRTVAAQSPRGAGAAPRLNSPAQRPRKKKRSGSNNNNNNTGNNGSSSLDEQCNRPLRPYVWKRRDSKRKWTRSEIEREREEFFETRVTGRQEIWAALKMVAEEMRIGHIENAQGILDAAGITTPYGDLVDGCYDASGISYKLEPVLVADPPVIETFGNDDDGNASSTADENESDCGDIGGKDIDAMGSTSEEKEKGAQAPSILVTVRLSDSDRNMRIRIGRDQHVHALEKRLRAEADVRAANHCTVAAERNWCANDNTD
ncbi:hypothetical protein KEM56_004619 [Ascosphaera pollenicola]|nr:hypothetical protein KEM56_004619 [Ascosphaera pollenicola]